MAPINRSARRRHRTEFRQVIQRDHGVVSIFVEAVVQLLRLPLALHVVASVLAEFLLSLLAGRR